MAAKRVLKIGIAPYEEIKARTLAIARGKVKTSAAEPRVWFTSLESLAQVLSTRNQLLLELIARSRPVSMTDLARASGRQKSNLSRTLHTLERYGLVHLERRARGRITPRVAFDRITLDIDLKPSA